MKHVNVVTDGINYEVGAMALNGVMSAVPGTKTLEEVFGKIREGFCELLMRYLSLSMFMDSMGKLFS